jgi:hypothetical protein
MDEPDHRGYSRSKKDGSMDGTQVIDYEMEKKYP